MTENLPDTNVGNIEYIRKQDAIDAIHCDITITGRENAETVCKAIASFTDGIKALEPADVAPVIHARWRHYESMYACESCGAQLDDESPFCPMCGAKMDGERREE